VSSVCHRLLCGRPSAEKGAEESAAPFLRFAACGA
jgi:hypothetical protein